MATEGTRSIGIERAQTRPNEAAVGAALAVLDRFMAALNAGDEAALWSSRSLWVVTDVGGRWAVADRSSFAD
jgi:hypothetical protein